MIELLSCKYQKDCQILLEFSDGIQGVFDLKAYLEAKQGPLLEPLAEEVFARRCFIEAGALCWPNGLELSPARLHEPPLLQRVA